VRSDDGPALRRAAAQVRLSAAALRLRKADTAIGATAFSGETRHLFAVAGRAFSRGVADDRPQGRISELKRGARKHPESLDAMNACCAGLDLL